jgi:hypothetical protein
MPPDLVRTQRWLQRAIVAEQPPGSPQVRRRILPSKALQPEQRLDIYRDMYEARLYQALATDYPAVLDLLGERAFARLVHLYLGAHPSRSYTLNRLGDRLPEFIANELTGVSKRPFLHDLARYELAQTMVFDEQETASLAPGQIAAVPSEAWAQARIRTIAALRLLELGYPVHRYARAAAQRKRSPKILRKQSWVAVYRVQYAVGTLELTAQSYKLLSAIAAGSPLSDALAGIRASESTIGKWFREWAAAGLFAAILPL